MIDVRFYENKGKLCLKVEGHANAAPKGEDIVCAGVSALAVALADTLEMMHRNGDLAEPPEIRAKDGDMRVKAKVDREHGGSLLLAFLFCQTGMLAIWRGYPKHVQIKTFDKAEIEAFSKGIAHPDGQEASMHNFIFRPGFRFLQLFAEGGGEGGTGAGTTGPTEAAPVQPQFKGAKNPLADVQYGTNAEPAAAGQDSIAADDRAAQFEALIKGEYKDLYEDRLKDTISKRLKGTEETVRRYDALSPVLGLLAQKYGVDANDAEALSKAIEDDETFYEDEALEKGMTVQQVKDLRKMQRENAELKRQMEERQSRERAEQDFAVWMQEAEQLKQIYPSFDLNEELQNPKVRRYLMAGVPLRDVYEQTHLREIIGGSMQYSANRAAEKVAKSVASGMRRPAEGAMGSQAPVVSKRNVSQLTRADREEILRRAERGEKIGFD